MSKKLITSSRAFRGLVSAAALILGASAAVACDDAASQLDDDAEACDALECGDPCATDADCAYGMHCGAEQVCTAECTPANSGACDGAACDDNGRCSVEDLLGEPWENACGVLSATLEPVTPTVVLLIDQSGSMTAPYAGGSRWDVLEDALMNPNDGVVANLDGDVRFGMALYTSHNGFAGGTCPMLGEVDVALDNHSAMETIYSAAQPDGDTPTGEALVAVADKLAALQIDGPKAIILATDGEPDTCTDPNPGTPAAQDAARDVSIAAAEHAYESGIQTYVLAVGNEVGEAHLQDMANAGAGLEVGGAAAASFYKPDTKAALLDAFNSIIEEQRTCVFAIESTDSVRGEMDPRLAKYATVTLDGVALEFEGADGWRMMGDDHIELVGGACQAVKSGEHELEGTFLCEPPPGMPY